MRLTHFTFHSAYFNWRRKWTEEGHKQQWFHYFDNKIRRAFGFFRELLRRTRNMRFYLFPKNQYNIQKHFANNVNKRRGASLQRKSPQNHTMIVLNAFEFDWIKTKNEKEEEEERDMVIGSAECHGSTCQHCDIKYYAHLTATVMTMLSKCVFISAKHRFDGVSD